MYKNPLPGVVDNPHHLALLYGNLIGGIDLTVKIANNRSIAWNTVTMGGFLAQCQRKWDFQADIFNRFAGKLH